MSNLKGFNYGFSRLEARKFVRGKYENLFKDSSQKNGIKQCFHNKKKLFNGARVTVYECKYCKHEINSRNYSCVIAYRHLFAACKKLKDENKTIPKFESFDRKYFDVRLNVIEINGVLHHKISDDSSLSIKPKEEIPTFGSALEEIKWHIRHDVAHFIIYNSLSLNTTQSKALNRLLVKCVNWGNDKKLPVDSKVTPSSSMLRNKLIDELYRAAISSLQEEFSQSTQKSCSLAVDSWQSVSGTKIFGYVLTGMLQAYADGKASTATTAKELYKEYLDCIEKIEDLMKVRVGALITDDASANVTVKRWLREARPDVVTLRCFAHMLNLVTNDLYKCGVLNGLDKLQAIAKASRTDKFYTLLEKEMKIYKNHQNLSKKIQLTAPTRWNSAYETVLSFLKKKTALMNTSKVYKESEDIPERQKKKVLAEVTPEFVAQIEAIEKVLRPIVQHSLVLQKEQANLADVFVMFMTVYDSFENLPSKEKRHLMQRRLAVRWFDLGLNQVLAIAAYSFSPRFLEQSAAFIYATGESTEAIDDFWISYIAALRSYVDDLVGSIPDFDYNAEKFGKELTEFYSNEEKRDKLIYCFETLSGGEKQPQDSEFWAQNFPDRVFPNLSKVAKHILSIEIQTASVERLFSLLGLILSPLRNRMDPTRLCKTAVIKSRLLTTFGTLVTDKKLKFYAEPKEYEFAASSDTSFTQPIQIGVKENEVRYQHLEGDANLDISGFETAVTDADSLINTLLQPFGSKDMDYKEPDKDIFDNNSDKHDNKNDVEAEDESLLSIFDRLPPVYVALKCFETICDENSEENFVKAVNRYHQAIKKKKERKKPERKKLKSLFELLKVSSKGKTKTVNITKTIAEEGLSLELEEIFGLFCSSQGFKIENKDRPLLTIARTKTKGKKRPSRHTDSLQTQTPDRESKRKEKVVDKPQVAFRLATPISEKSKKRLNDGIEKSVLHENETNTYAQGKLDFGELSSDSESDIPMPPRRSKRKKKLIYNYYKQNREVEHETEPSKSKYEEGSARKKQKKSK